MKINFIFKLVFVLSLNFLCKVSVFAQDTSKSPIALWNMSTIKDDSILVDAMGNYNAILRNYDSGSAQVEGKIGSALNFDGTKNYVYVGPIDYKSNNEFTISFWVKPDITDADEFTYVIWTGNYPGANSVTLRWHNQTKEWLRFYVYDQAGSGREIQLKASTARTSYDMEIMEKKWMYVTAVFGTSSSTLYIDGEPTLSSLTTMIGFDNSEENIETWIGASKNGSSFFKGELDEYRIYDYALTESEVKELKSITTHANMYDAQEYELTCYPSPFSSETTISYSLNESGKVNLEILNINGQKVTTLVSNKEEQAGAYQVNWDGTGQADNIVPNGIYFYRLTMNNEVLGVGKIVFSK